MDTLNFSPYFKLIHVSGDQAKPFLQSQLTNDVQQATLDRLQWQAYCTRDGLVQSMFALWGGGANYYLLLAADLVENTLALLQKYARFSKVSCAVLPDVSIELKLESGNEKTIDWQVNAFDARHLLLTWRSVGLPLSSATSSTAVQTNDVVLRTAFIAHEFPWLCQATIGCFRPHDIHLPELNIICFKKGCFPGQEIIARMHYRGKPKQGFYIFHLLDAPDLLPGQIIVKEEKQIGQIVDAVRLADQTVVSMVLQHEWCERVW